MFIGNTMLRICAHLVIENTAEAKMPIIVNIMIDLYILKGCVKIAILMIIIKGKSFKIFMMKKFKIIWKKFKQKKYDIRLNEKLES